MLFPTRLEVSIKTGAMPLLLIVIALWEIENLLILTFSLLPNLPSPTSKEAGSLGQFPRHR